MVVSVSKNLSLNSTSQVAVMIFSLNSLNKYAVWRSLDFRDISDNKKKETFNLLIKMWSALYCYFS